jgi:ParB family chromosome partitioning protein
MQQQTVTADFRTLAIDQLRESPTNPRRTFDEAKLQELAQSIRAQGILVPLIVRETGDEMFEVIAGARRFRAAQQAELFNAALFDDFIPQDDRCLSASCFREKVDAHIARQKQNTEGLIQITRAYYNVSLRAKKTAKSKSPKCGRNASSTATKSRKAKGTHVANRGVKKVAQKGGAA